MKLFLLLFTVCTQLIFAQMSGNELHNSININDGLVAFYPFNGNANDESGNGYDGTVSGATLTTDRFNQSAKAYNFVYNGFSSDKIQLPGTSGLNYSTGGFSLSAWVQFSGTTGTGNNYPIFSKHICGEQSGYILMLYNGKLTFWLAGSSGYNILSTPDNYTDENWHHVAAVYDGVTQYIYVDGLLKNSTAFSYNTFNEANCALGGYNGCNGGFNGKVDEIKVFNRPLSNTEIQQMYNQSATGLVAFYPFNGNANDESGNSNNPTYIGSGVTLTTDRFGNADKAYYFDGNTDSYIRIPADNFPTTDRTISFWFNADQIENHPTPLSYGGDVCYNSVLMIINKGDYPNAYTVLSHCASNFISAPYSVAPVNNWYYLTMTISGVTQKIFINGELQQTTNSFSTPTFVTGKSAIFGAILYTDGNTVYVEPTAGNFQGKLDDFRFYDHALSDAQVLQLYNGESSGLVAFYPFNGNANDGSTNGNHGTVYGATLTTDRFGNLNSAYNFNGVGDYISVSDNSQLFSDEMTIAWWCKVPAYQSGAHVVIGWVEGGYRYQQFFDGNSFAYLNGYNVTSPGTYFNPTYNLTAVNEWQHLLVTYKKLSETSSTTALYVNGELKQTDNHTLAMAYQSGFNFYIGKNHNANWFNGDLDDIRIYNLALSDQEIWKLYKATTTAPNLIAPSKNSTLNTLTPGFYWDSLVTAISYKILLTTDSTFSTIIVEDSSNTKSYLVADGLLSPYTTYYWKVRTINDGGIGPWSEVYNFKILLTGVENEQQLPTKFALMQSYPNPFNPTTKISWQSPIGSWQTLKVFDVLGNEIVTLVNGYKEAGSYEVEFNPSTINHHTSSGIYFYQLKAGNFIQSKKMLLIK
jgi:hypothetical protein